MLVPNIIHEAYNCDMWLAHSQKCTRARCFVRCYRANYVSGQIPVTLPAIYLRMLSELCFLYMYAKYTLYKNCYCKFARNSLMRLTKRTIVHKCVRGLWARCSILDSRINCRWQMLTDVNGTQLILHWRRHQENHWLDLQHSVSALSTRNANKLLPFLPRKNYDTRNLPWSMIDFCEVVPSWGTGWRIDPTSVRFICEV
jgi:hypothetical protein